MILTDGAHALGHAMNLAGRAFTHSIHKSAPHPSKFENRSPLDAVDAITALQSKGSNLRTHDPTISRVNKRLLGQALRDLINGLISDILSTVLNRLFGKLVPISSSNGGTGTPITRPSNNTTSGSGSGIVIPGGTGTDNNTMGTNLGADAICDLLTNAFPNGTACVLDVDFDSAGCNVDTGLFPNGTVCDPQFGMNACFPSTGLFPDGEPCDLRR